MRALNLDDPVFDPEIRDILMFFTELVDILERHIARVLNHDIVVLMPDIKRDFP